MRQLVSLCLLGLVSVSYGYEACCVPRKWEGSEVFYKADVSDFSETFKESKVDISYDAENKLLSLKAKMVDAQKQEVVVQTISDYHNHVAYFINLSEDRCFMELLLKDFEQTCVPEYYIMAQKGKLGLGDKAYDIWHFLYSTSFTEVSVTVTESCFPILQYAANKGAYTCDFTYGGLQDVTLGIADPGIFDVPESCRPERVTRHKHENELPHEIKTLRYFGKPHMSNRITRMSQQSSKQTTLFDFL